MSPAEDDQKQVHAPNEHGNPICGLPEEDSGPLLAPTLRTYTTCPQCRARISDSGDLLPVGWIRISVRERMEFDTACAVCGQQADAVIATEDRPEFRCFACL